MLNDPRTEPLREWTRLARENAENAIVSSMFEAAGKAIEPIEKFSTWLLVGAAAIASFLITNSDKVIPLLGTQGFAVCGACLCLSCVFGLLAKVFALRSQVGMEVSAAVRSTFATHLAKHEEEERKIKEGAEFWGIDLKTGIRLERILGEFYKPFPRWVGWLARRNLKKNMDNPQVGYLLLIRSLQLLGYCTSAQALAFLAFLVAGFLYAAGI